MLNNQLRTSIDKGNQMDRLINNTTIENRLLSEFNSIVINFPIILVMFYIFSTVEVIGSKL